MLNQCLWVMWIQRRSVLQRSFIIMDHRSYADLILSNNKLCLEPHRQLCAGCRGTRHVMEDAIAHLTDTGRTNRARCIYIYMLQYEMPYYRPTYTNLWTYTHSRPTVTRQHHSAGAPQLCVYRMKCERHIDAWMTPREYVQTYCFYSFCSFTDTSANNEPGTRHGGKGRKIKYKLRLNSDLITFR